MPRFSATIHCDSFGNTTAQRRPRTQRKRGPKKRRRRRSQKITKKRTRRKSAGRVAFGRQVAAQLDRIPKGQPGAGQFIAQTGRRKLPRKFARTTPKTRFGRTKAEEGARVKRTSTVRFLKTKRKSKATSTVLRKISKAAKIIGGEIPGFDAGIQIAELFGFIA